MENIKRDCNVYEDSVILYLEDLRDNYICEEALGKIGQIEISSYGYLIIPEYDDDEREKIKQQKLEAEVNKLFGKKDNNALPESYYAEILSMIENGTLASFGYTIQKMTDEYDDDDAFYKPKSRGH